MSDGPKLYDRKPKKVLKQKAKDFSTPSMATSQAAPAPPPPPPKESFARRYKFVWPLVLAVNLAVGAYLFVRTKKKDTGAVSDEVAREPSPPAVEQATTPVPEKIMPILPVPEPEVRKSVPEEEQRKLFKWILEEKRKIKPISAEEKKHLDEEKAILKQLIRSKSIPSI